MIPRREQPFFLPVNNFDMPPKPGRGCERKVAQVIRKTPKRKAKRDRAAGCRIGVDS